MVLGAPFPEALYPSGHNVGLYRALALACPAPCSRCLIALQAGWGEYVVVRPDVGLFFPAMGLVRDAVLRAAAEEGGTGTLPVVLDCSRFSGLDFTAVKVPDLMTSHQRHRERHHSFV